MVRRLEVNATRQWFEKVFWPDNRALGHATLVYGNNGSLNDIVVHEMTHYSEGSQGERFPRMMNLRFSDWRTREDQLKGFWVAGEDS